MRPVLVAASVAVLAGLGLASAVALRQPARTPPTLAGTSWESADDTVAGCQQALTLHSEGRYDVSLSCPAAGSGTDRVVETLSGYYRLAGRQLTLAAPETGTCPKGRLVQAWTGAPLDYELSPRGALTLFRGNEALPSLHPVHVPAHPEGRPGCVPAALGMIATSSD